MATALRPFLQALVLPPGEPTQILNCDCAGDRGVRAEILSLLQSFVVTGIRCDIPADALRARPPPAANHNEAATDKCEDRAERVSNQSGEVRAMLRINLFGKLCMQCDGRELDGCDSIKSQELFCYLLLNRDRPHARELLAGVLWGDYGTTAQSKKYLSKALWQLRRALNRQQELAADALLVAEPEWIKLRSLSLLWLDVAAFEDAYTSTKDVSGANIDEQGAKKLEHAVQLYGGHLLENWYQDWCLYERQRYHEIYLLILDKLMEYSEARHYYEAGLSYGNRILRYDQARERTHRQMMRLYYRSGRRTGALRQYEHCVSALKEELDVEPSRSTTALYEQVKADRWDRPGPGTILSEPHTSAMGEVLTHLRRLQTDLAGFQRCVRQAALVAESELGRANAQPRNSNEPLDISN